MSKIEKLKLIEGTFTSADAKEVLMNVFSSKINFHERRNFSHQERYGADDEHAAKRISSLNDSIESLLNLISEAEKNNRTLQISSDIIITFSDK
jgi:hypothetical protein|tara:strand:- start:6076 stop:6357 length:282 start_codon:yes stop_codon:yes gene_type:complete